MALDDLLKGIQTFNDGMIQWGTAKAVNAASEELGKLNSMEMDKEQRLEMQSRIGNDLMLRLTAIGTDPNRIAQISHQLSPSAGAQFQAEENENLQENAQGHDMRKMGIQHRYNMEEIALKAQSLGHKNEEKLNKSYTKYADTFRKENKDTIGALAKFDMLADILDKTPDRVGVEMAKTGLLKAAGEDRVSDTDVERAQRDPSLRAGIARKLQLELDGTALKDDRKFYQSIMKHAKMKMNETLTKKATAFGEGTAQLDDSVDGKRLAGGILSQLSLGSAPKTIAKRLYSAKMNKTKIVYSDGSEEVVEGKR